MLSRTLSIFLVLPSLFLSLVPAISAQTLWESKATISDLYGMTARQWAASERIVRPGDFNGDGLTDVLLQGVTKAADGTCKDVPVSKIIEYVSDLSFSIGINVNLCFGVEGERNTLLLFGEPDGGFTDRWLVSSSFGMTLENWAASDSVVHIADFDRDGRDDVLLQGRGFYDPTLILFGRSGTLGFGTAQNITLSYGMSSSKWGQEYRNLHTGDFDGDGNVDLLLQGKGTGSDTFILYGNGYGGFSWVKTITSSYGMTASQWAASERRLHAADFDSDGRTDVLLQGEGSSNNTLILYGQSNDTFTSKKTISDLYGMSKSQWSDGERRLHGGDFDGDGLMDLLLQGRQDTNNTLILYGEPGRTYTSKKTISDLYGMSKNQWAQSERHVHVADFDLDGHSDVLLQGDESPNNTLILYGRGSRSFSWRQTITNSYGMSGSQWAQAERLMWIGDYNGDGFLDLLFQGREKANNALILRGVDPNAPEPLWVSILGPSFINQCSTNTWSASVSGGSGSTSYNWKQNGVTVGSSASLTLHACSDFMLSLSVTKGTETDSASKFVTVSTSSGCTDGSLLCESEPTP